MRSGDHKPFFLLITSYVREAPSSVLRARPEAADVTPGNDSGGETFG